jgi:alkylation response protein AidB-like acyl-CoA dehydrogenase
VDLSLTTEDEAFRGEVRAWLSSNLTGEFAELRGVGGSGREHEAIELRKSWERALGAAGWVGLGLPMEVGGRGATLMQQVIFAEEYARAAGPGRVNHMGEHLLAPTLVAFANDALQQRFLPGVLRGEELWCQGYSEPGAGSDLAAIRTRARLIDGNWILDGQKVWTSLAADADWCFVVARTEPGSERHRGLSYLLVPMRQPGVEIRPIVQMTGSSEFSEVFFDGARTDAECVVGDPGDGWRVAMGTLGFERGVATLAQQIGFERELDHVIAVARETGAIDDVEIRTRIVDAWIELRVMRYQAMRTLGSPELGASSISKLLWGNWHRSLGELAMDVRGTEATILPGGPYELSNEQSLFLFTRADTIYAGSNEIQRNIIADRVLRLPRGH